MSSLLRQLSFVLLWFFLSTGIVASGAGTLHYLWWAENQPQPLAAVPQPILITIPQPNQDTIGQVKGVETVLEVGDGRAEVVARFLERYKSPLQPYDHYGEVFVKIADTYGFDFRLLPAIAMQESNLCKSIPPDTFNCLGFGIHERGTLAFESFEANFDRAGRELKKYYIDIGLTTPDLIMTKYTPSSNGSWANSVNQWMAEMRYNDRQMGLESSESANVMMFAKPAR